MYFSMRSLAANDITEPKLSPGIIVLDTSHNLSIICCTPPTATMADAAIHLCPAHPDIDAAILVAAISRCASGRTIK